MNAVVLREDRKYGYRRLGLSYLPTRPNHPLLTVQ